MVRLNTNKNTLQYTVGPCASSFMSELSFSTHGHYYFPSFTMALLNTGCNFSAKELQQNAKITAELSYLYQVGLTGIFILFWGLITIHYSSSCQINLPTKILLL